MTNGATVFSFDGFVLPDVTLAGVTVDVVMGLDDEELDRRNEVQLGPVDDRDLLEVLGHLPLGWRVPVHELDPVMRVLVEGAPPGLVERMGDTLVRCYRPAIRTAGVIVHQREWRRGIELVSRFASVAPRGLIVTGSVADADEAVRSVRRLGIGLAVRRTKAGPAQLLVPADTRFRRPGTAEWLFSERVFAEWRRRQVPQAS
jgi:hypothetical protein